MKVIALTLTTLCLAVVTQASWDYTLQCTREEIGIRWPSYYSNSEYYVCPREGGRQVTMACPAGEVFTFVLQTCTSPKQFVPPPPLNVLPTSSPTEGNIPQPIEPAKPYFPKPIHTPDYEGPLRPPVLIPDHPPMVGENPDHIPPFIDEPHHHHPEHPIAPEEEKPELPSKPALPPLPGKPHLPIGKPEAPLPPTPAPTPPVVPVAPPAKKKQPPSLPGAGKKQPPKPTGEAKKQPPKPTGKKQPPKPAGKKQIPSLPGKA